MHLDTCLSLTVNIIIGMIEYLETIMLVIHNFVQQALQSDVVPQQGFLFFPDHRVRRVPLLADQTPHDALSPSISRIKSIISSSANLIQGYKQFVKISFSSRYA